MKKKAEIKMVLIASAEVGLRQDWTRALQDVFAIQEVSDWPGQERVMIISYRVVLLLDLDFPAIGHVAGISAVGNLSPSTKIILFASRQE